MPTLYELDAKIRDFPFEVDPDTGELLNVAALDALKMERNQKLENIACFYKNVSADAAAIKAEEAALKKRREALERTAERLKSYLADSLGGQKIFVATRRRDLPQGGARGRGKREIGCRNVGERRLRKGLAVQATRNRQGGSKTALKGRRRDSRNPA